jgi:hypothetical protein
MLLAAPFTGMQHENNLKYFSLEIIIRIGKLAYCTPYITFYLIDIFSH